MDQWTHNGRDYRLCRIKRYERDPLTDPSERPDEVHYNVTQTRRFRWFSWRTLREEEVPGHVLISLGCFGDCGDWRSKLFEVSRTEFGMPG
jgi:hypothetical protein